ncbi:MAG TPA: glycosyltransferase family 9 protein [Burkholderiaceae bacterium]|nr:glycosyltransferase family 9 protein [Burkholderiaceae bacterium]
MPTPPAPPREPLVVRVPNYVGDVVLCLPAFELLTEAGYDLHLYGKGFLRSLTTGHPGWRVVIRAGKVPARIAQLRALRAGLARAGRGRPAALALPHSFSSALELRLGGFAVAGLPTDGRSFLLSRRLTAGPERHSMPRFLSIAADFARRPYAVPAALGLALPADAIERARREAAAFDDGRGFVCVAPFVGASSIDPPKKWPGFPELVRRLRADGVVVVLCPGPGETAEAHERYPGATIVEDLPLDAYAALMSMARLVVAGDTGPGHVAAAVGARLISVVGPTPVDLWRPWGPTVTVLARTPEFPSMDEVLGAARTALGIGPGTDPARSPALAAGTPR